MPLPGTVTNPPVLGPTPNLGPVAVVQESIIPTQPPLSLWEFLPERTSLVLQGNSYGCVMATGEITVAAQPTGGAEGSDLAIFNGESIGPGAGLNGGPGKTYIIDRVFAFINVTAAAATQLSIIGQIIPAIPLEAGPADTATILRWSLSGRRKTYLGKGALVAAAAGALITTQPTAVDSKWFIMGSSSIGTGTANVGTSVSAECYGRYLVPPGCYFAMNVITGTATGAAGGFIGFEWHEVQLQLPA